MTCQIIPSPEVDPQIVMALHTAKAFLPKGLRTLFVVPMEPSGEDDVLEDLAQWVQHSGYREATLRIAPALSKESADSIMQVLRHELVHGHLHQLDVFVESLIATCPGNRARNATTKVYHMLRESVADDISYAVGDVVEDERERQKMACLFKMADDMVDRLKAEKAKEQAIW